MNRLAVGLMSGTSADGVSLALASFDKDYKFELVAVQTFPYPKEISKNIIAGRYLTAPEISGLNFTLGKIFSKYILIFLKKNKIDPPRVQVLGSHGQTIFHQPRTTNPNTLQIGESSLIAERTGITVVSDFRPRHIACGGEGAPLIPFFDQFYFGKRNCVALQNIGGIANVSLVGKKLKKTIAFDTGPGNCLIDWAVQEITKGKQFFDRGGQLASRGKVSMGLVRSLFQHPYFKLNPPKSTGRELFNEDFIPKHYKKWMFTEPFNFLASITYFTAFAIADSYQRFIFPKYKLNEVILSGGGCLNQTLISYLRELLSPVSVRFTEDYGIPVQAKEPLAFAFFGLRAVDGKPNSIRGVLGKITPGKKFRGLIAALGILFLLNLDLFAREKVLLGIDVLVRDEFASLQGRRVGLVTNHTGVNRKGERTIDLLFNAKGVQLESIFSPEHGVKGKAGHGVSIADGFDIKTKVPIYSLYGKQKRPTDEMLRGLDTLVFDVQDIGARFYTYTTTLAYLIEDAARRNIELIVLDRPNPVTGAIVEGDPLDPLIQHFTAYLQIPVRHGFTIGEIANWYNRTSGLNARLNVIKMAGWNRGMWWEDCNLKFIHPSPNIRSVNAALLYSGIGALEATNVSVGRGTGSPFELFGAPWMDGERVRERLEFFNLPGFKFKSAKFTPKNDLYKGELCKGVRIVVTDKNAARPYDLFIYIALILRDFYPDQFVMRWEEIERVTGSKETTQMIKNGDSAETILFIVHEKAVHFSETRKPYLLYE